MAVTRIKNNQITDATIFANVKIAPQTIVGTLFNPDVTINSNISIVGNLTVTGNTQTVNSINTLVNDPLVVFNSGYVGTPSYDVGVLVNRNLQPTSPTNYGGLNTAWVWREDVGQFQGILTTETGSTQGTINRTAYANLSIGNTIIQASSVDSVSSTTGGLQVTGGMGVGANVHVAGTNTVFGVGTGVVAIDGNIPIVQITQVAANRYGLMITDTNNDGALAFKTNTADGALIQTFGGTNNDIKIQADKLKSIWIPSGNGAVIADIGINSTSPNVGAIIVSGSGGIGIGGNLNVGTSASFETGRVYVQSPAAVSNAMAISKGTLYSGIADDTTVLGAGIGATSVGTRSTVIGAQAGSDAPGADSTLVGFEAGKVVSGTNNQFFGTGAGKTITTGNYNVILGSNDGTGIRGTSDNNILLADGQGNMRVSVDTTGNVYVWAGLNSTSSNTGAMVVQGGVGVGGNLNVGGAFSTASGRVILDATATGIVLAGNTATTYMGADSVLIGQKIGSGTNFGTHTVVIGSEAANTNTNGTDITLVGYRAGYSGAGQRTTAIGSQAGLNLLSTSSYNQLFGYNAGSQLTSGDYNVVLGANTMTGLETVNNYIMLSDGQGNGRIQIDNNGVTTIYSTVQSDSSADGALVVYGGVGIGGNVHIQSNLTVQGNLTVLGTETIINTQNLTVNDAIIDLHTFANLAPLTTDDGLDIGLRFNYYKGSDKDAFLGWANDSGFLEYYALGTETDGAFSGTYGTIKMGELWATNTTPSTDTTSGAVRIAGGLGIVGNLNATWANTTQIINSGNFTSSGTNALITLSPTGTGYVTIAPNTKGSINNMAIGQSTPVEATFTNLTATSYTTLNGSGYVSIQPTGTVTVNPTATGNMDNVYIGNTTPRQASFTAVTVGQDLQLSAFLANSALFVSPSGNVTVDQKNQAFNFQRTTGNTFSTVSLSVGHTAENNLLRQGTDTLNIRYQGDSYLENSSISANVLGQSQGWTTSTSRGTATAPEVTQDGDFNGVYGAYAWTGATPEYKEISSWRYVNQGDSAATDGIGGQAQLWTKRDNGDNTLALRVDAAQVATFTGQVIVANTTTTTNSTDGALYVHGGTGIDGNLVVGEEARINDHRTSYRDFVVRGDNDNTLIWARNVPAYNQVIIGNSAIAGTAQIGAKLQINSTDAMIIPVGSEAQRPGGAQGYGSAVAGMIRFNTVSGDFEYYTGSAWFSPQTSALTLVTDDVFYGDDTEVTFTLSRGATTNGTFVTINGVMQQPTVAYSVSGNQLTFTEAPATGDVIDARTVTLTSEVRGLSAPQGYVSVLAQNDGVVMSANLASTTANTVIMNSDFTVSYNGTVPVTVGTSPVAIHSFEATKFRSAKYVIQVSNSGGSSYEVSEVMVLHDGTTAYRTQYNRISTLANSAALGSVTTSLSGGTVTVYYTGASTGNQVKAKVEMISTGSTLTGLYNG